ncbi:hypothetical protein MYA98_01760 [Salmonella sp. WGH-01]|nr:hypothetical protein MYA98_01760 [Salmonella sp. WGH-01]
MRVLPVRAGEFHDRHVCRKMLAAVRADRVTRTAGMWYLPDITAMAL